MTDDPLPAALAPRYAARTMTGRVAGSREVLDGLVHAGEALLGWRASGIDTDVVATGYADPTHVEVAAP